MNNSSIQPIEQNDGLIRSVEAIVSNSLGKSTQINSMERLTGQGGHSPIYRCFAASGETFIIKMAAESPRPIKNPNTEAGRRFLNDWVGAEFLSSLNQSTQPSPHFHGGDQEQGFFVLEDLGSHLNLVDPLLKGNSLDAESGLLKYYTCLGSIHAMTVGKAREFEVMYATRFPGQQAFAEELVESRERIQKAQELLHQFGVTINKEITSEIEAIIKAVTLPGPFLAYIHCDPCPDNLLDLGDQYRFIDFEWGHFGHMLLDVIHPRMMWPSCWCANRLPDEIIVKMEDSYRARLIQVCPEVQEDAVWELGLVQICGITLLNRIAWDLEEALREDRKRGIATNRQRMLAQIEAFINASETFDKLPALRAAARHLLSMLQEEWMDTTPLAIFPSFNIK